MPQQKTQQQIVAEIQTYEATIAEAKAVIDGNAGRKQAILDKYLKWHGNSADGHDGERPSTASRKAAFYAVKDGLSRCKTWCIAGCDKLNHDML